MTDSLRPPTKWYTTVKDWTLGATPQPVEGAALTARELEVLRCVAQGKDNDRIADVLSIAEGTVKNHVVGIYAKLNMRSRAAAVAWAWQHKVMEK